MTEDQPGSTYLIVTLKIILPPLRQFLRKKRTRARARSRLNFFDIHTEYGARG